MFPAKTKITSQKVAEKTNTTLAQCLNKLNKMEHTHTLKEKVYISSFEYCKSVIFIPHVSLRYEPFKLTKSVHLSSSPWFNDSLVLYNTGLGHVIILPIIA
jgi:hypothetical protein